METSHGACVRVSHPTWPRVPSMSTGLFPSSELDKAWRMRPEAHVAGTTPGKALQGRGAFVPNRAAPARPTSTHTETLQQPNDQWLSPWLLPGRTLDNQGVLWARGPQPDTATRDTISCFILCFLLLLLDKREPRGGWGPG